MTSVTVFSDFEARKIKICHCFHFLPSIMWIIGGRERQWWETHLISYYSEVIKVLIRKERSQVLLKNHLYLEVCRNWRVEREKNWINQKKVMWFVEDEMIGWHHQLNGHDFEQALEVGEGQGSLACCSPWGHKEWLNWTESLFKL